MVDLSNTTDDPPKVETEQRNEPDAFQKVWAAYVVAAAAEAAEDWNDEIAPDADARLEKVCDRIEDCVWAIIRTAAPMNWQLASKLSVLEAMVAKDHVAPTSKTAMALIASIKTDILRREGQQS